jgi:uncharacterized caspase-like protein
MLAAVEKFGQSLNESQGTDIGLFYYSGHGHGDYDKGYYLIPIDDSDLEGHNLEGKTVSDKTILTQMDHYNKGKGINIVMLDACRDNPPFGKKGMGFFRTGLETHYQSHIVVGFAAELGKTVSDRHNNTYSLYTEKLLEALEDSSSKPLKNMFRKVEKEVEIASNGMQIPETIFFGLVGDNICLGTCF